jgi:hypothetical protein
VTGTVDAGHRGLWLLDPADLNIDSTLAGSITASLNAGTNVIEQTTASGTGGLGDINVNASISWNSSATLTLSAYHDINIASGVVIANTNNASGNLILRADNAGIGSGTVTFGPGSFEPSFVPAGQIDFSQSQGKVSIYYDPTHPLTFGGNKYETPTNFGPNVSQAFSGQLTAYMLVNSGADLALINTNAGTLSRTYALGRDITVGEDFTPIGNIGSPFTGVFDGRNPISGGRYTIDGLTLTGGGGLFGAIGSEGIVRNLNLTNVTNAFPYYDETIGAVAGVNNGTIDSVSASGTFNMGGYFGVTAGGLVGLNTGTIRNSTAAVQITVGDGITGPSGFNYAGGLVGINTGTITGSSATGAVTSGANTFIGGLVGQNGNTGQPGGDGSIDTSFATGAVSTTVDAAGTAVGGLVGYNKSSIANSYATGPVSGYGVSVGGLVGTNADGGKSGPSGSITGSYAAGPVDAFGSASTGGLVGRNESGATIAASYATGAVTSTATGAVDHIVGGLVGENMGQISGSYASGSVKGDGGDVIAGGLVGTNNPATPGNPTPTISNSYATGDVTIINAATNVFGGGLAGANGGDINGFSYATGNVSVSAARGIGGGLVGLNIATGEIFQAYASGNVSVSGSIGVAGGFVGVNLGYLNQTFAIGAVSGTATDNVLGGFVGANTNTGTIFQAYATGAVTGSGNSIVGGFAAVNVGTLDQTYAIGRLSGGTITGGLVGANTSAPLPAALTSDPDIGPTLTGTGSATNSYWDTQTTGVSTSAQGNGVPTTGLIAALPPGFDPSVWTIQPDPSYPYFAWQPNNTIPMTNEPVPPNIPSQQQIIDNLTNTVTFASLNTSPVITTQNNGVRQPQFPPSLPPGAQPPPTGQTTDLFQQRVFDVPPLTETRFISDQVLLQIKCDIAVPRLEEEVRRLGLELMASQSLCTTTGTTALQFRITDGKTVRDVIRLLASVQIVAIAQPIYIYVAGQETAADPTVPASRGDPTQQQGDAAQYILQKLRIPDVHRIVRGTNVPIAVIDSEIDAAHPDLAGMVAQRFSAVGAPEKPHSHGTGMAGAIASHQRLMGMAPSSRIYAVHAFSPKAATAESTTYAILKGLDWATTQGVRIINMSFAGPKDPSLERAIKVAYDKGIVLIAAAGNAGPTSPPLYPGADPNVIAVTATDAQDKIFTGANRGKYVSVAAPGVDILVPAPDNAYQLTTGTSVAAAEVSGIVALLLERNPRLTPVDIRRILTGSARRLAPGDRTDEFGSGLVDPLKALQAADPRLVTSSPPLRQR